MQRDAFRRDWLGVAARLLFIGLAAWLLQLSPQPDGLALAYRGYQQALRDGQPAAAANHLELASGYFPWRKDLLAAAAFYRLQAGDLPAAEAYFEQPGLQGLFSSSDWVKLGDAFYKDGDTLRAESAWLKALEVGEPGVDLYDRLVQIYHIRGDFKTAAEMLRPTLALRPDEPRRAYQLGVYLAAFQPEAALVYLEQGTAAGGAVADQARELQRTIRSAQLSEEPAFILMQSGRHLAGMGEWRLAVEAFLTAVEVRPDYAEAWAFLGEARQHAAPGGPGDPQSQALSDLERAYALNPTSAAVNSLLALYWQRRADVDKMIFYLSAASSAEPENPVWQADLGRALALGGDLVAAQQQYQLAIQLAPQDALYYRLLGEFSLSYQVDIHGLGLPALRQALALAPGDAAVLDLLGAAYLVQGNNSLAERFLTRALQSDQGYALAYLHLGLLNLYRDQGEEAYRLLRKAEQLAPPGSEVALQARQLMGDN